MSVSKISFHSSLTIMNARRISNTFSIPHGPQVTQESQRLRTPTNGLRRKTSPHAMHQTRKKSNAFRVKSESHMIRINLGKQSEAHLTYIRTYTLERVR